MGGRGGPPGGGEAALAVGPGVASPRHVAAELLEALRQHPELDVAAHLGEAAEQAQRHDPGALDPDPAGPGLGEAFPREEAERRVPVADPLAAEKGAEVLRVLTLVELLPPRREEVGGRARAVRRDGGDEGAAGGYVQDDYGVCGSQRGVRAAR